MRARKHAAPVGAAGKDGHAMRSTHVSVQIDLDRVRLSAEHIRSATGVPLIAVIKSDAYGLGAVQVADALEGIADDFAYFSVAEAREVGRPGIVLGPPDEAPSTYAELRLRPAIGSLADARRYARIPSAVNVDTGMQRFGCDPESLDDILADASACEIFTHAVELSAAMLLRECAGGRGLPLHAASTSLLDAPEAWLDAVRPGLALYRGAVRVTTRLAVVRETRGRVGYGGLECPRVGVIMVGYSHHLRPAPVVVNGRRQRVLEVGMNTAFVSLAADDREGDEVILLGEELDEIEVAKTLGVRPHEVLCSYAGLGPRSYLPPRCRS
ncbi:MAG: hypothetical protein D6744_17770 [Planctomycetota bacterium]|nr:MAG: hypothetical protein D6744_17770 [Planctomycetota bacterium]